MRLHPLFSFLLVLALLHVAGCSGDDDVIGPAGQWRNVGPGTGGSPYFVRFHPTDPDVLYMGADCGGLFRSTDCGESWENLTLGLFEIAGVDNPSHMAFDPRDPRRIYVLAMGVYISPDGGRTWQKGFDGHGHAFLDVRRGRIEVNPYSPDTVYAGFNSGQMWVSADRGITWHRDHKFASCVCGIAFLPGAEGGPASVFVSTREHGIFRSGDEGATWQDVSAGLPHEQVRRISAASDPGSGIGALYACIQVKEEDGQYTGAIYRSDDLGETWVDCNEGLPRIPQDTSHQRAYSRYFSVCAITPESLYVTGSGTKAVVCYSGDGGRTWESRYSESRMSWVGGSIPGLNKMDDFDVSPADPDHLAFSDTWHCFVSRDGGRTVIEAEARHLGDGRWQSRGTNHLCSSYEQSVRVSPHDSERLYFGYHDVAFASSDDRGETYFRYFFEPFMLQYMMPTSIVPDPAIPGRIYMSVQKTGGPLHVPDPRAPNEGNLKTGGVAISDDHGRHWRITFDHAPRPGWARLDRPKGLAFWTERPIVKCIPPSGLPRAKATNLILDPTSPAQARVLYVSVVGHGVYRSADSGTTWAPLAPLPVRSVADILEQKHFGPQIADLEFVGPGTFYAVLIQKARDWTEWYGTGVPWYKTVPLAPHEALQYEWGTEHLRMSPSFTTQSSYRSECRVYLTQDDGQSWRLVNDRQFARIPISRLRVDPRNDRHVLACGYGGVFESFDGAATFRQLLHRYYVADVQFDPHHEGWLYAGAAFRGSTTPMTGEDYYRPGLWLSRDGGGSWESLWGMPECVVGIEPDPGDARYVYVGTRGSGVWRWQWD